MAFSFYLLMPTLPFFLTLNLGADKGTVGLVLSVYVVAALLIRPFSGYFVDNMSRKRLYVASYICFVMLFAGYLLVSSLGFFILLRVLHGLVWGVITIAGNTLAIDIMPSQRRGEGIGYYGLSTNLAMATGPTVGLLLYEGSSMNLIFYIALGLGTAGVLLASSIRSPRRDLRAPEAPAVPLSLDRFILVRGIPVGVNLLLVSLSYGMIATFAAMYGKEAGVVNTGLFFMVMAVGIMGSRLFAGKLIDRGKILQVSLASILILAAALAGMALTRGAGLYFTVAFVAGAGFGLLYPSMQTLIINLAPHNRRGTANSTYYTASDLGIGAGMVLGGRIAEWGGLSASFAVASAIDVLAVVLFLRVTAPYFRKYKLR